MKAYVRVSSKKVIFEYNEEKYTEDDLINGLKTIGYQVELTKEDQLKQKRKDMLDLLISFLFSMPLLWTMFSHLGLKFIPVPNLFMNGYFQFLLATPVLFISGRRFFKSFYYQLKNKTLGMDALIVLGVSTSYIYSIIQTIKLNGSTNAHYYFETTAVLIFMVLIGNYFENRVKEKTDNALFNLISLGSKEARVLENGIEVVKKIEDVLPKDIIVVLANEKIPLDGKIIKGETYIDEQMLTGESMPVAKNLGDNVIGASFNMMETIHVLVEAVGSDTVLAKIIETVEETSLIKPKAQRVADTIAKYFVPIVVVIAIITFLVYKFILLKSFSDSIDPAMAALIISCPCALGLATPTSIAVASGIAFRKGILYKGGEFFEIANKIKVVAFDKTGTLTEGRPEVSLFIGDNDSLIYTASLEKHSNHPLASAILNYYQGEILDVSNLEILIGEGLKGNINDKLIYVGSKKLIDNLKIKNHFTEYEKLISEGKTVFFTVIDNKLVNLIAIEDKIKASSYQVIKDLKRKGIIPFMITGDNYQTANYIGKLLEIDHIYADVLPHEKANIIKEIQEKYGITAFVGDGINDAPALKMADCSFAVSNGSDIALDASDVTLMKSDLGKVLDAIILSEKTLINIYINFFWAFIYNIIMIPLAALGYLNPTLAGIGMSFSSIMVVLNALSLKLYKIRKE